MRIVDENATWRIFYRIDRKIANNFGSLGFNTKTQKTAQKILMSVMYDLTNTIKMAGKDA